MNEDVNVAVVQKIYADFAGGNVPAVLNAFADDIVFKQPVAGASPLAGTFHGPEEVGRWFAKVDELTETQAFEPREFVAQGNKVVAFGYYKFLANLPARHGTPSGRWFGLSAKVRSSISSFTAIPQRKLQLSLESRPGRRLMWQPNRGLQPTPASPVPSVAVIARRG